jgi:hypothetical protein
MDIIHGALVFAWCTCCVLTEQLKHAEKQAARIPLLKEQLNHPCADMTAVEGP